MTSPTIEIPNCTFRQWTLKWKETSIWLKGILTSRHSCCFSNCCSPTLAGFEIWCENGHSPVGYCEPQGVRNSTRRMKSEEQTGLLLFAKHALINASSIWQFISENIFTELGLEHISTVYQLLVKWNKIEKVKLLVIKTAEDFMAAVSHSELRYVVQLYGNTFTPGNLCNGFWKLRFYGLWIEPDKEFSCSINVDLKLQPLDSYLIRRDKRKKSMKSWILLIVQHLFQPTVL